MLSKTGINQQQTGKVNFGARAITGKNDLVDFLHNQARNLAGCMNDTVIISDMAKSEKNNQSFFKFSILGDNADVKEKRFAKRLLNSIKKSFKISPYNINKNNPHAI